MCSADAFPLDWSEWRRLWVVWESIHIGEGNLKSTSYTFGKVNILADAVLGVWSVNGRDVELSEVRMPAFGEWPRREVRHVGLTWGGPVGSRETDLVTNFAELEARLGI